MPKPKCKKCGDTGIIETGNNDLPCDCLAGNKALFNTAFVDRPITGREFKKYLATDKKPIPKKWTQESLQLLFFLFYRSLSTTGWVQGKELYTIFGNNLAELMQSLYRRDLTITRTKLGHPKSFSLTDRGRREAKRIRLEMTY